jgi:hypothetical protein
LPERRAILSRSRLEQSLDVQVAQDRSQAENHGMDRVAGTSFTRNLPNSPDLVSGAKEEGEMERRRWSAHESGEITKYGSKVSSKADCRGARTGFVRDNGQSPPATNFAQDEATWRRHVPECRSRSCGFRFPKGTKLSESVSRTAVGINARRSVNALPQGKAPQGH